MKRLRPFVLFTLILLLGAAWMEAQKAPPARPAARKAKKVWTNEDFPERPAPAVKAQPQPVKAGAAGTEPPAAAAAAGQPAGPAPTENLDDLEWKEKNLRRQIDDLREQQDAINAEIKALKERRDAERSPEVQLALGEQILAKQKQAVDLEGQKSDLSSELEEIQKKKAALQPPPEEKKAPAPESQEAKPQPPSPPPL